MIVNDELMERIICLSFLKVLKLCNIQPTCNPVYKKNLICSFDRVSSDSILVLYHELRSSSILSRSVLSIYPRKTVFLPLSDIDFLVYLWYYDFVLLLPIRIIPFDWRMFYA